MAQVFYADLVAANSPEVREADGRLMSRERWRYRRRVACVYALRKRLNADPQFAAERLLKWLTGVGGWQNRKTILNNCSIKRSSVLTAATKLLKRRKLIDFRLVSSPYGGRTGSEIRAKKARGRRR